MEIENLEISEEQLKDLENEAIVAENEKNKKRIQVERLKNYYASHFPTDLIFRWLTAGYLPSEYNRREISYIVRHDSGEEFCIRNMSYDSADKLFDDINRLNPLRIDIGPVYENDAFFNKDASKRGQAVEREFVIDIDMNDYNDIRTCCEGKALCQSCWKYLVAAKEVLCYLFDTCFGFKHVLWIFSGRRGIHAWVSDLKAKRMPSKVRKSITEFLNFTISNEKTNYLLKPPLIMKKRFPPLE